VVLFEMPSFKDRQNLLQEKVPCEDLRTIKIFIMLKILRPIRGALSGF
jgi:hypothetical protein